MMNSLEFKIRPTRVYYLKMEKAPEQKLIEKTEASFTLLSKPIATDEYLRLYKGVGEKWNWLDRQMMPKEELEEKINAKNIHIYVMKIDEEVAGYVELQVETDFVELVYFGLMPAFIGKGYGKYFLDWSIHKAWSFSPQWIQLNTCELDHEHAL